MLNIPLLKIDTDKLLNQISQENQTIPKVEIQYPAPRKTLCDVIKDFPKQNKEVSELLKEKNETKAETKCEQCKCNEETQKENIYQRFIAEPIKIDKKALQNILTKDQLEQLEEIDDENIQFVKVEEKDDNEFEKKDVSFCTTFNYDINKWATLQKAIDEIPNSSKLVIPEGIYNEYLKTKKDIYLKANGKVQIIGLESTSPLIILDGIDVYQKHEYNGGIDINQGNVEIKDCNILTNVIGIELLNNAHANIENTTIKSKNNPCILACKNSYLSLVKTTLKESKMLGILAIDNSIIKINSSTIINNEQGGILVGRKASLEIKNSNISDNGRGIEIITVKPVKIFNTTFKTYMKEPAIYSVGHNIVEIKSCNFINCYESSIQAKNASTIISEDNTFQNSGESISIIMTRTASINSKNDKIIGKSLIGMGMIEGGQGFIENINIEVNGIGLYAGGEGSLISCNNSSITNTQDFSVQICDNSRAELENLTIKNCNKSGIIIKTNAKGKLTNVSVHESNGCGCEISNSKLVEIAKSEFNNNKAVGLLIDENVKAIISQCKFIQNEKSGIEISGNLTDIIIQDSDFIEQNDLGVLISDDANVSIQGGMIMKNNGGGIMCDGAKLNLFAVEINYNENIGLFAQCGSQINGNKINFIGNKQIGCQVSSKNTLVQFNNTLFKDTQRSCSIISFDEGSIICTECLFVNSKLSHVESRSGGAIALKKCDLSRALSGIGCQVHQNGFLHLIETYIHDESKIGISVSSGGYLDLISSTLTNCNGIAIAFLEKSRSMVQNSLINGKDEIGFEIDGGSVNISNTRFKDHKKAGIFVKKGSNVVLNNIFYENNGKDFYEIEY